MSYPQANQTLKVILHIIIFVFLTVITQIGGIIYLISILAIKKRVGRRRIKRVGLFIGLYLLTTFLIVPKVAPLFGREKIKETPDFRTGTPRLKIKDFR